MARRGLRLLGVVALPLAITGCAADPCTWRIAGDTGIAISWPDKPRLSATVCLSPLTTGETLSTTCGSATVVAAEGGELDGAFSGQFGVTTPTLDDGTVDTWQYWIVLDASRFQTPLHATIEIHDAATSERLLRAAWTEEEACTDWSMTIDVRPRDDGSGGGQP